MSENEITFKQKLCRYLNRPWNFCINQIKKAIDMTNLAEHCLKTQNKEESYSLILEELTQDKGTQTDDIQESPKRKRAKLALQMDSEVFGDDDNSSGKFSTNYSADISELEVTFDESPIRQTLPEPG